jgi:DNA-binding CsgD family transcriptional regulator
MGKKVQRAGINNCQKRAEQAETRTAQAETRTEQARTRAESAETRTEQAETRTEWAKHRTEQAEIRTEQAETRTERVEATLQRLRHKEVEVEVDPILSTRHLKNITEPLLAGPQNSLKQLTGRQREILRLIAEGQNTKSIAELLKVSPKTVEYHRMKLMAGLNLHDIPGLVRFALRTGLIPQGS